MICQESRCIFLGLCPRGFGREMVKYLIGQKTLLFFVLASGSTGFAGRRHNTLLDSSISPRQFDQAIIKIAEAVSELCRRNQVDICESWKILTDPKNPEFWKEGNHVPDQGWVTMVQDMTVDSAKLFLLRGEIKALYLSQAMSLIDKAQVDLISAGLMRDRYNVISNKSSQLKAKTSQKVDKAKFKDLQYFFIFSN